MPSTVIDRFVSVVPNRPDYTRPLRMQAAGRSAQAAHRFHLRCLLWGRALKDRAVWGRAFRSTVGVATGQVALLRVRSGDHLWLMAMIPLSTLFVALTSAAASCVGSHFIHADLGRN